jgi:hypothetical protein
MTDTVETHAEMEEAIYAFIEAKIAEKYPPAEYDVSYVFDSAKGFSISAAMNAKAMEKHYPELGSSEHGPR